ncbi:MAG: 30S ribosomal protein S20 [Patescibacteria group bacterium]|nr:30S ribosomal protein S20 [Patescibacteria group bacterium]
MPNTQSAKKRLRQNVVRRARNRSAKQALRTQCRKVRQAVQDGDLDRAEAELRLASKRLDRAGVKNIIHRNAAARTKSRLSGAIRRAKQATAQ